MKKNKKRQKDKTDNPFNPDYFSYMIMGSVLLIIKK